MTKGRAVQAYIAGLNHEKIAELAKITLEECEERLTPLTRDQAKEIHKHYKNDSLVVIDEAESLFPAHRQPLQDDLQEFVAEHGHYGLDIIGTALVIRLVLQLIPFVRLGS